ncbi:MAG: type II toxin-antitoxin system PemK/MazF family toxin [Lachnospiraceae bacterium]|jgi:mRNA-degrading endonuclease toxin of MazEF toxin-antitoxin module|nr:type II toxin-antitoxin system PemK/MazF family toxin [Lachnospiraceae bacterium]
MSKEKTEEDVIRHKKKAIHELNNLMETYIKTHDKELLKKADLISYWLESFSLYIGCEDSFEPSRLIRYSRGDVLRLNFGFNIGKEFGGLHFAVVIDNDNKRSADVLTVVPLSSSDGKKVHERSVDLGTELFEKISVVQHNLLLSAKKELDELIAAEDAFATTYDALKKFVPSLEVVSSEIAEKLNSLRRYQDEMLKKKALLEKSVSTIERNNLEISKLKKGSLAVTNQITTVSKQRIYTPKRSEDFLYGISLSNPAMEKINAKLKELYLFE